MLRNKLMLLLFASMGLSLTAPLYAIAADDHCPVHIRSQSLSGNFKQGIFLYQGEVVSTQGTKALHSDQLYAYEKQNQLDHIKVLGNPAKTQEQVNLEGQIAYGQAKQIDYFPQEHKIQYQNSVDFRTNGNVFKGDLITYNTVSQIVLSPEEVGGGQDLIILPPNATDKKS